MLNQILSDIFLLFLLTDPLAGVVVFLSMLKNYPSKRIRYILARESIIAGITLMIFLFIGKWVIQSIGISSSALEISGGILLFLIALPMIFPEQRNAVITNQIESEPFIVPIAIPLMAGPASLAVVIIGSEDPTRQISLAVAIGAITIINAVILTSGSLLIKIFGNLGLKAMERLMGLVLITIAVQLLISGIKAAFMLE